MGGLYKVEMGEGGDFGSTGVWDTSCPSPGIPTRLPRTALRGDIL